MYKINIYIFKYRDGNEGALFTQTKIELFFKVMEYYMKYTT